MSVCACVDRARARGFTLTTMCISSAPVQRSGRVIMRNCYKAVTCPVCGSATMPYAAEGCAPLIVTASWVVAVAVAFSSACALPHWSPDAEACPQHHGSPAGGCFKVAAFCLGYRVNIGPAPFFVSHIRFFLCPVVSRDPLPRQR